MWTVKDDAALMLAKELCGFRGGEIILKMGGLDCESKPEGQGLNTNSKESVATP